MKRHGWIGTVAASALVVVLLALPIQWTPDAQLRAGERSWSASAGIAPRPTGPPAVVRPAPPLPSTAPCVPSAPVCGAGRSVPAAPGPLAANWANLTNASAAAPPGAGNYGFVYDPALGGTVLFGGYGYGASDDTWLFSNGSWIDLTSQLVNSPGANYGQAAAYDPAGGELVAFGGGFASPGYVGVDSTWLLNTTGWTKLDVTGGSSPSERTEAEMAYYPACSCLILFGGYEGETGNPGYSLPRDTWEFANNSWTRLSPGGITPPAIYGGLMVYDAVGDRLLLFGGGTNAMYAYQGGNWSALSDTTVPSQLSDGWAAAAPTANGSILAYGGLGCAGTAGTYCNLTWSFQNGSWAAVSPAEGSLPPPMAFPEMVLDPLSGYDLLAESNQFSTQVSLFALPGPLSASVRVSSAVVAPGEPFTVTVAAQGGWGTYQYSLHAPSSCQPAVPSFRCWLLASGTYNFTVNVTDGTSNTSTASATVVVCCNLTVALNGSLAAIDIGTPLRVSASTNGGAGPFTYAWSGLPAGCPGGDNSTLACSPIVAGNYSIQVEVLDRWSVDAYASRTVTVNDLPTLLIQASPRSGVAPLWVNLSATVVGGTGPIAVTWVLADGSSYIGPSTSELIEEPGAYGVSAVAVDLLGAESRDALNLTVLPTPTPPVIVPSLTATISSSDLEGPAPLLVTCSATVTGGVPPYSYFWVFGNGAVASTPLVTAVYPTAGNYTITLLAEDSAGRFHLAFANITVLSNQTTVPPPSGTTAGSGGSTPAWIPITGGALAGAALGGLMAAVVLSRRQRVPPPEG